MLYVIWGSNGKGKTYCATDWAIKVLKDIHRGRGTKKRVFSNYPIVHKKYGATLFWNKDTINYPIHNALIIIDESYFDYSARDYRGFTKLDHLFFATNRHNDLDIVFLTQGVPRLDTIIREMVTEFLLIRKYGLPFIKRPLFFKIEGFTDEASIANRHRDKTMHSTEWVRFKKSVGNSYDTRFYRNKDVPPTFLDWDHILNCVCVEDVEKFLLDDGGSNV